MLRRAAALIASALLLHLNVLSVARECSSPPEATTEHSEHADHSQSPLSDSPSQPQSQAQCCDAMFSCALSLQLGGEIDAPIVRFASAAVQMPGDVMHAVARRAPDPPPPRSQA